MPAPFKPFTLADLLWRRVSREGLPPPQGQTWQTWIEGATEAELAAALSGRLPATVAANTLGGRLSQVEAAAWRFEET